jgi:hypothetical protein
MRVGTSAARARELQSDARRQIGCTALVAAHHGVGAPTGGTILAELGDSPRFPSSREAVRDVGLDILPCDKRIG